MVPCRLPPSAGPSCAGQGDVRTKTNIKSNRVCFLTPTRSSLAAFLVDLKSLWKYKLKVRGFSSVVLCFPYHISCEAKEKQV